MRAGRRTLVAGGLGTLCVLAGSAWAEDAVLAPVTASAPPLERAEADRAPASPASTIEIAARTGEATTLPEVIASVPGAVVRDYGGPGQLATLSLRGSSPQEVLVLLDGVPLTGASSAIVDLATLPVGLLDRVEVVRGSVGAIYGPGALGGVVNLVTRAPSAGAPSLSGSITSGSFSTGEVAASGAGQLGPGAALVAVSALNTDGDFSYQVPNTTSEALRVNNDVEQVASLGRYTLLLAGGALDVRAEAEELERGLAGTADNPSSTDRYREDLEALSARYSHRVGPVSLELLPFIRREQTQSDLSGYTGAPEVDVATGVEARTRLSLGNHALAGVVSAGVEELDGAGGDPYRRGTAAVGASDEWLLAGGRVSVLPALRLDQVGDFTGFSPNLAGALRPVEGLELRASIGRSFRAPTLTELYVDQGLVAPNPTLVPESGTTAELGAAWIRGGLSAQAAAYASLYEDLIAYELALGSRLKPYNVAVAGIAGGEVEAAWRPIASLSLSLSYSYERTADLRGTVGYYLTELPYHPRHTGDGRVAWRGSRLRGQAEVLAQSSQQTNPAGTDPLGPRVLVNAGGAVRFLEDAPFWLGVEAKNLLDDRTEDLYGYPLAGRALYATLSFEPSPPEHR